MEVGEGGAEEGAGLLEGLYPTLDEEVCEDTVDTNLSGEFFNLRGVGRFAYNPFAVLSHNPTVNKYTHFILTFQNDIVLPGLDIYANLG